MEQVEQGQGPPPEKRIKLKDEEWRVESSCCSIYNLPDELLLRILSFLNFPELLHSNLVNQVLFHFYNFLQFDNFC